MNSEDLFYFKLKKDYFVGFEVFEIAKEILGQPASISLNEDIIKGYAASYEWIFNPRSSNRVQLTIDKHHVGELSINIKQEYSSDYIDGYWQFRFKEFRSRVTKPWSEWTEEEILCDPMWIYFFSESNSIPERFHNAMVLFSYQNIQNFWVKRYFNAKNKEKCFDKSSC